MTFSGKPLPLPCPPCPARLTWKQVFPETFGTSQNDSPRLAWLALCHCFTTTHHKTSQRKIPRLTICSLGSRSKLPTPFDARCSCSTRSPHIFASLKHLYLFTTSISAALCHQQSVQSLSWMPSLPGSHSSSDWCLYILHIHSMTSCSAQMLQLNAKQGKGWNVVQTPNIVKFDQTIKHWIHPSVLDWELTTFYSCLLFSLVRETPKKIVHNNHEGVPESMF